MSRDEFEAAIWRALRPGRGVPTFRVVDDILRAGDQYAASEAAIGALHRQQLEAALKGVAA